MSRALVVLALALAVSAVGCPDGETEETQACPPPCGAVVQLSLGEGHGCFLSEAGEVSCFGTNDSGELGQGHTRPVDPRRERAAPVDLGAGRIATFVAAGPQFSCAVLDDATVKCWGANGSGQLGQGDVLSRGDEPGELGDALPPVRAASGELLLARQVAAGQGTACAVRPDGALFCWGNNTYGQLGPGRAELTVPRPDVAIDLGAGLSARSVHVGGPGGAHVCAVVEGARSGLKCWGYNGTGGLGLGSTSSLGADQVGDLLPFVDLGAEFGVTPDTALVAEVALGHRSTCARSGGGVVKCWGYGHYGLGSGDVDVGNEPGEMGDALGAVPLPGPARSLFAGGYHFCATLDGGELVCWGRNDLGQLGVDAPDHRGDAPGEPLSRALVPAATRGAADEATSCVEEASGTARCWGGGVLGGARGAAPGERATVTSFSGW